MTPNVLVHLSVRLRNRVKVDIRCAATAADGRILAESTNDGCNGTGGFSLIEFILIIGGEFGRGRRPAASVAYFTYTDTFVAIRKRDVIALLAARGNEYARVKCELGR